MPKPIKVDAGDRAMLSQATGKPVVIDADNSNKLSELAKNQGSLAEPTVRQKSSLAKPAVQTAQMQAPQPIVPKRTKVLPSASFAKPASTSLSDIQYGSEQPDKSQSYWDIMQDSSSQSSGNDSDNKSENRIELSPEFTSGYTEPSVSTASMGSPQAISDNIPNSSFRMNDVYERDMIDNGLSEDYIDKVLKESNTVGAALDDANGLRSEWRRDLLDQLTTAVDDGTMDRPHLLSDWMTGKQYYHYVHDLGLPGMPEKQIDVSDDSRYSKTEQQQQYGFTPYIPNNTYLFAKDFMLTPTAATRRLSDYVSNLRTRGLFDDVDYDIDVDTGQGRQTFSGREYDNMSPGYFSQSDRLYDDAKNGDKDALSAMISDPGDTPYTTMVKQTRLPDGSLHYGVITKSESDYDTDDMQSLVDDGTVIYDDNGIPTSLRTKDDFLLNIVPTDDGYSIDTKDDAFQDWNDSHLVYRMEFSDGSSAELPFSVANEAKTNGLNSGIGETSWVHYDDTDLDIDPTSLTVGKPSKLDDYYDPINQTGSEVGAYFSPDMVLPDGTRIPRDVAERISSDKDPDDTSDGITYSFQRSGLNPARGIPGIPNSGAVGAAIGASAWPLLLTDSRPRRFLEAPVDENGFHIEDLPNNLADWAANSMTISLPYVQWLNSFSQAMPYSSGVNGQNRSETGRYSSTGFEPGDDKNAMMSVPVLAGPAFENLAGNIGHETWLDNVVNPLIDRKLARGTLANILAHHGFDMFGEGIEENFGDIVDELGTYGSSAYSNPLSFPPEGMNVYDKDGNLIGSADNQSDTYGPWPVMYDEHGRELKDPSRTTALDRIGNFIPHTQDQLRDAANSFLGGAGVSALMGGPSLVAEGIGSYQQRNRGDWGSPSYAAHMNALDREMPYAGKSISYAMNDARRRNMGKMPDSEITLPESLLSNQRPDDDSDIIRYDPEKYMIPDDAQLPELR